MAKKYLISRDLYRKVKKMDAEELGIFLGNVFQEGYNSAVAKTDSITLNDLHDAIASVKGIGSKRMTEIDTAITKLFNERNGS